MNRNSRICVVGSGGALGMAVWDMLARLGYQNLIPCTRDDADLRDPAQVSRFFEREKPEYVFFLAALAAGIQYKKTHPVEMLADNLQMEVNVFAAAHASGCRKLLNVSSSLLYPQNAEIPVKEEEAAYVSLKGGVDSSYTMAKAAGFQLARFYQQEYGMEVVTAVPCNFFGEKSSFEGDRAGVVPSLIARFDRAKEENLPEVEVWGTGNACRDVLNSKDVASACILLMKEHVPFDIVNIGRGEEFTIREIALTVKKVVGYEGQIVFDLTKPEGRMHTLLDNSRISGLGWKPAMTLEESITDAYLWYMAYRWYMDKMGKTGEGKL